MLMSVPVVPGAGVGAGPVNAAALPAGPDSASVLWPGPMALVTAYKQSAPHTPGTQPAKRAQPYQGCMHHTTSAKHELILRYIMYELQDSGFTYTGRVLYICRNM